MTTNYEKDFVFHRLNLCKIETLTHLHMESTTHLLQTFDIINTCHHKQLTSQIFHIIVKLQFSNNQISVPTCFGFCGVLFLQVSKIVNLYSTSSCLFALMVVNWCEDKSRCSRAITLMFDCSMTRANLLRSLSVRYCDYNR